jgi:hypothetical protein
MEVGVAHTFGLSQGILAFSRSQSMIVPQALYFILQYQLSTL